MKPTQNKNLKDEFLDLNNPEIKEMWADFYKHGWSGGENLQEQGFFGQKALAFSLEYCSKWVPLLIKMGVDVNELNIQGQRPLDYALSFAPQYFETLLEAGAQINPESGPGFLYHWNSPHLQNLWPIFKKWHFNPLKSYQSDDNNSEIDTQKQEKMNYLTLSCQYQPWLVEELLDVGFDINSKNELMPVLHLAVSYNPQLLPLLIDRGADLDIKDWEGLSVFHLADEEKEKGRFEAWTYLQTYLNQKEKERLENVLPSTVSLGNTKTKPKI